MLRTARALVRAIPDVPINVNVPPLGKLRIRMRRHRWFLYQDFRQSDAVMIAIFDRLVRPGDVVYDIGANIGVYTRYVLNVLQAARVEAFEPMAGNLELLRANIALGNVSEQCSVHALALGDTDGEEDLQIDDVTSGTAVLNSISGGHASQGRQHFGLPPAVERVRVRRLDSLVLEGLTPPNVMKIDTEGAEAHVLRGALQTLRDHRPRLTIALHGADKAHATLVALQSVGYVASGAVRESGSVVYRRLGPGDAQTLANNNIVAAADESLLSPPLQILCTAT